MSFDLFDHPRRSSTVPPLNIHLVPPAPPLPPPRYTQQARNALHRVFGFSSRTLDQQDEVPGNFNRLPRLSAHNASASHKTGLEINSLSINDQGTHALLAGREIFKTVRVEEATCTEDANIRTAIRSYDATTSENVSEHSRPKDAVDIHDVAWAKGTTGNFIAAATYNGPIILYDLNRLGIEIARLYEHRRQVHRVTFNPHAGHLLLSASQDGTVRLWDIRDCQRNVATFQSRLTVYGKSEGVRDVKWSPTDVMGFALGTDGGWVQRWDLTMPKVAKTKIAAHSATIHTIDWHPDGKHLLSASADKSVRVWNMSTEGRRNKAAYEIKTPHPLRNARWRPPCQSSLPQDSGARQCTQIATSYEKEYPLIHIWDTRRPQLPFRELENFNSAPTDLLWHSEDLLWAVGREGTFLQSDVKYAGKVIDKRNLQAFAVSPLGEIHSIVQKRFAGPRGRSGSDHFRSHRSEINSRPGKLTVERMNRGSADDSLDETFLSASFKLSPRNRTASHTRTASLRDTRSLLDTPSSQDQSSTRTLNLDEVLNKRKTFTPGQSATRGLVPGSPNVLLIEYFAQKYKTRPYSQPASVEALLRVQDVFYQNAKYAQHASMYRMAQSWRLVGQTLAAELKRRATHQRQKRIAGRASVYPATGGESPIIERARKLYIDEKKRVSKPNTPRSRPSAIADALQRGQPESSSQFPTPIARPVSDNVTTPQKDHASLSELEPHEFLTLPPSLLSPLSSRSPHGRGEDGSGDSSLPGGASWYGQPLDVHDRRAVLSSWRAQPRELLTLEPVHDSQAAQPPRLTKQDSNESFGVFPSLASSHGGSFVGSISQPMGTVHESLRNSSSGSSFFGSVSSSSDPAAGNGDVLELADKGRIRSFSATQDKRQSVVESPDNVAHPIPPRTLDHDMQTLMQNNQESFSSESEAYSASRRSLDGHEMENLLASGTIVPDRRSRTNTNRSRATSMLNPPSLPHATASAPAALATRTRTDGIEDDFIPADFLPSEGSTDTEARNPFTLIAMLKQLLNYHTTVLSDAQASTHFLLLLMPLLPETYPLAESEMDSTLSLYTEHLSHLGHSEDAIFSILQTSFEHLIKAGLQPLQAESIMSTYHDQLLAYGLYNNAAFLRRLAYPTFPAVYEQALKDNEIRFRCGGCRKPINNPTDKWHCESCHNRQAECPICWCRESPFEAPVKKKRKGRPVSSYDSTDASYSGGGGGSGAFPGHDSVDAHAHDVRRAVLYSTCLLCCHSAHAACLTVWHETDSAAASFDSTCPTPGCVCDCVARQQGVGTKGLKSRLRQGSPRRRDAQGLDEERIRNSDKASASTYGARKSSAQLSGVGGMDGDVRRG